MKIEALDKWGIKYNVSTKYDQETKTHEDLGLVKSLYLNLTPEDWVRLCTTEGDMYMGGCCANMSVAQDILNYAFRESGWIDCARFREYGELCSEHDGFEDWTEDLLEKNYTELEPLLKLGYIWVAVNDKLAVQAKELPEEVFDDSIGTIARRLARVAGIYGMGSIFNSGSSGTLIDKQKHGQNMVDISTMFTLLRLLYDKLDDLSNDLWEGFAVRKKATKKVAENAFGLCLFPDRPTALKYLEETAKYEGKNYDVLAWEISPCKVTKDGGLSWSEEDNE